MKPPLHRILALTLIAALLVGCRPDTASGQATPGVSSTATSAAMPAVTRTPVPTPASAAGPTSTPARLHTDAVLTWLREGGIAGFCDAVAVYGDGQIEVSSCQGNRLRERKSLSMDQRDQLQTWVKTYEAFEYEHRDQAVADSMRVRLTFAGKGTQEVSDAERQAMLDWASALVPIPAAAMPSATEVPTQDTGTVVETKVRYVLALKDVTIYRGPGTTYESIGPVFEGQVALVAGTSADGAWWRVICPDDTVGDCWVSADPELTEPATPPDAWPVYMMASGVSVEYPIGWSPSPGGYDGAQESVWFVSPDEDVQPVVVEVYHRPLAERHIADPYSWQPNEGGYLVHWAGPISTVGGLSGLEFVWGAYSEPEKQWDTAPSLMAIFYSEEHELDIRLTASVDPATLDMLQTAGYTETVQAPSGVLRRMAQSIRLHPTTGWETYRDTEADGLFELKHPPDWMVQGNAFACGVAYDLDSLKLLVFEGCWADRVGGRQLTFFDTLQHFRNAFGGEAAVSSRAVSGMQVEVVHYRAAGDNGIVALDPGPGTVALWQVGEQGYALIDQGNRHQGDGAFDGVLGSFLLLPPMPRGEPRPLEGRSVEGGTAFDLPGVGATIVLPAGYGVVTNNEYNRRGSLVSFDFTPYGGPSPRFAEIQFFSEASIRTFHERCAGSGGFCFEGDYPDVDRYHAQKAATAGCTGLAPYEATQFGGRCYLVADHRCTGDACVLREYTTFLDETMVSVLIVMQDPSQVSASDELFASFDLAASQPIAGNAGSIGRSSERYLRVDQAAQRMYVYEHGIVVRELPVSTGRPTSVTLTRAWTGTVGKDLGSGGLDGGMVADFKWFLFRDTYGSVLIHSVPYTHRGDDKVYDQLDALGIRPTSRGCVRISPEDAGWLKAWDPVGVAIEITAWPGRVEQVAGA
jgi:hypothetical protein